MTSSNPRLIPGKSVSGDLVTWEAPPAQDPAEGAEQGPEAELAALRAEVREAAYEEGYAAGLEAAEADIQAQCTALAAAFQALARPLQDLDRRVEDELLELVRAVTRQLVRRELRTDPGEVIGVIRAGLDALPAAAFDVVVKLHPEDAALVRERLQASDADTPWRIQADPVLERGSCRIVSSTSQVDGRLETRLGRVIAALFDDPRGGEPGEHD